MKKLHHMENEPLESSDSKMSKTEEGRISISFNHSHLKAIRSSKAYPAIMMAQVSMKILDQEEQ